MHFLTVSSVVCCNSSSAWPWYLRTRSLASWVRLIRNRLLPYCASACWRFSSALFRWRTFETMAIWSSSVICMIHPGRSSFWKSIIMSGDTVRADVWQSTYGHRFFYSFFEPMSVWSIVDNAGSHGCRLQATMLGWGQVMGEKETGCRCH